VGVFTSLEFGDLDTAPSNWLRWYAKHVSTAKNPPWEPGPSKPGAFYMAYEAGLPVPPPPRICYTSDGTPVPVQRFLAAGLGPHLQCGPTPGGM
jgi:hypothetical protein